jgi:hypothetical protein
LRMKIVLGFLVSLFSISLYSQGVIEIKVCDEFENQKCSNLYRFSVVSKSDTIPIPYLGDKRYSTEPITSNESISDSTVFILLENCKYFYELEFRKKDFEYETLILCIENEKAKSGKVKWNYSNYYGRNLASYAIRKKK